MKLFHFASRNVLTVV